jgi:hypothetical protein
MSTPDAWAYETIAFFTQGHAETVYRGFDAGAALAVIERIDLTNGKVSRAEVRDRDGPLRTVYGAHLTWKGL